MSPKNMKPRNLRVWGTAMIAAATAIVVLIFLVAWRFVNVVS